MTCDVIAFPYCSEVGNALRYKLEVAEWCVPLYFLNRAEAKMFQRLDKSPEHFQIHDADFAVVQYCVSCTSFSCTDLSDH